MFNLLGLVLLTRAYFPKFRPNNITYIIKFVNCYSQHFVKTGDLNTYIVFISQIHDTPSYAWRITSELCSAPQLGGVSVNLFISKRFTTVKFNMKSRRETRSKNRIIVLEGGDCVDVSLRTENSHQKCWHAWFCLSSAIFFYQYCTTLVTEVIKASKS